MRGSVESARWRGCLVRATVEGCWARSPMSSEDEEWQSAEEEAPAAASKGKKSAASKQKQKQKQRVETKEQKDARELSETLKKTAVKSGVMRRTADGGDERSTSEVPLALRLDACNVIKKNSAKKIKFLFQLQSIFIPKGDEAVEIGSLHGLHSKQPVMLLKLPDKVLRLRGCVVYPKKCSYINLAKLGHDVKVEDTFDSVIVWGDPEIVASVESTTRQAVPKSFSDAAADAASLESSQEDLLSSQSQDQEEDEEEEEEEDDDDDEEPKEAAPKPARQSARAAAQPRKSYKDVDEDDAQSETGEDSDDDDSSDGNDAGKCFMFDPKVLPLPHGPESCGRRVCQRRMRTRRNSE